jgi:hypothetical protein
LEDLSAHLKSEYDFLLKNVPLYSKRKRRVAEIDILAFKDNAYDIFEVKCSYRITKARHQLNKIRKIISSTSKVRNIFFFCGESGSLIDLKKENDGQISGSPISIECASR